MESSSSSNRSIITITTFSSKESSICNNEDSSDSKILLMDKVVCQPCPPTRPPPPVLGLLGNSIESSSSPGASSSSSDGHNSSDEDGKSNVRTNNSSNNKQRRCPPPPPPLPRRPPPIKPWSSSESADSDESADVKVNSRNHRPPMSRSCSDHNSPPNECSKAIMVDNGGKSESQVTIESKVDLNFKSKDNNISVINVTGEVHLDSVDSGVSVAGSDSEVNSGHQDNKLPAIKSETTTCASINNLDPSTTTVTIETTSNYVTNCGINQSDVDLALLSPIKSPTADVQSKSTNPLSVVIDDTVSLSMSPSNSISPKRGGRFSISPVTSASPDFALFEPECGSILVLGSVDRKKRDKRHSSEGNSDNCSIFSNSPSRSRHHSEGHVTGHRFRVSPTNLSDKEVENSDVEHKSSGNPISSSSKCARATESSKGSKRELDEGSKNSEEENSSSLLQQQTREGINSSTEEGTVLQGSKDSDLLDPLPRSPTDPLSCSSFSPSKKRFLNLDSSTQIPSVVGKLSDLSPSIENNNIRSSKQSSIPCPSSPSAHSSSPQSSKLSPSSEPRLVSVKILSPSKVLSPIDSKNHLVSNIPRAINCIPKKVASVSPVCSTSPTFKSVGWIDSDGEEDSGNNGTKVGVLQRKSGTTVESTMTVISSQSDVDSVELVKSSDVDPTPDDDTPGQSDGQENKKPVQLNHSVSIDTDANGQVVKVVEGSSEKKKLKGLLKKSHSDSGVLVNDGINAAGHEELPSSSSDDTVASDISDGSNVKNVKRRKKSVTFSETMMVFCDDWPMEFMPQIIALKSPSADSFNLVEVAASGYMFEPPIEYQDLLPFDPPPDYRDIINQAVQYGQQSTDQDADRGIDYMDEYQSGTESTNYWGILNDKSESVGEDDIIGLLKEDAILQAIGARVDANAQQQQQQFTPPINEVNLGQDDFPVHYFKPSSSNTNNTSCDPLGSDQSIKSGASESCMENKISDSGMDSNNCRNVTSSPTASIESSACSSLSSCPDDCNNVIGSKSNLLTDAITFDINSNQPDPDPDVPNQTGRAPLSSLQASTINYHLHNLHLQAAAAAAAQESVSNPTGSMVPGTSSLHGMISDGEENGASGSNSSPSGSIQDLASDSSFTSQDTIIMMTNALLNSNQRGNIDPLDVDLIFDTNDSDLNSLDVSDGCSNNPMDEDVVVPKNNNNSCGSENISLEQSPMNGTESKKQLTCPVNVSKEEDGKKKGLMDEEGKSLERKSGSISSGKSCSEKSSINNTNDTSSLTLVQKEEMMIVPGSVSASSTSSISTNHQTVANISKPDVVPPVPLRKPEKFLNRTVLDQNTSSSSNFNSNPFVPKRISSSESSSSGVSSLSPSSTTTITNDDDGQKLNSSKNKVKHLKESILRRSSTDSSSVDGGTSSDGNVSDVSSNCSAEQYLMANNDVQRRDVPPKIPPLPIRKNSNSSVSEIRKAFERSLSMASSDSGSSNSTSPTKGSVPSDGSLPPQVSKRPKSFPASNNPIQELSLSSGVDQSPSSLLKLATGHQSINNSSFDARIRHHQSSFDISPTKDGSSTKNTNNQPPTINPSRLRFHSGPPSNQNTNLKIAPAPPLSPSHSRSQPMSAGQGFPTGQSKGNWQAEDMLIEYTSEPRALNPSKRANSCSNFHAGVGLSLPNGPSMVPSQQQQQLNQGQQQQHGMQPMSQAQMLQNQRAVQEHIYMSLNRRDPHNHLLAIYHPQQQQNSVQQSGNQTLPRNLRIPPRSASVMGQPMTQQQQQQQQIQFQQQSMTPGNQMMVGQPCGQQQLLLRTVPVNQGGGQGSMPSYAQLPNQTGHGSMIPGQQQQNLPPCCVQHAQIQQQLVHAQMVRNQMIWQQQLHQHLLRQQPQLGQGLLTTSTLVNQSGNGGQQGNSAQSGASPGGLQQQSVQQPGPPDVIPNTATDQTTKMVTGQTGVNASPRIAHLRPAVGVSGHGPLPPIPVGAQVHIQGQNLGASLTPGQQALIDQQQPIYQTLQPTCSCCPRNPHAFPGGGKLARIAQLLPTTASGRFPNASEIRRRDGLNAYPQVIRPNSVIVTSSGHPLDQQMIDGAGQMLKDNSTINNGQDPELQQFVEREKERTERIKQRYATDPPEQDSDDPSFGFSKRPTVRGIKST